MSFTLKVVTPNEVFFEGQAESLQAPGTLGYFGVLSNHAPFVTTLEKGRLSWRAPAPDGRTLACRVEQGFLEVLKNRVLVLTDKIET